MPNSKSSRLERSQLRIVHVFRDPVGGIFRHVRDLVAAQHAAGHAVGIICDSSTGGDYEDKLFEQIRPQLDLGLHRIGMARSISPTDIFAVLKTSKLLKQMMPDIAHCHSAKGGVYGRVGAWLASSGNSDIKTFYCPHGGAMHYSKQSLKGKVFFAAERMQERFTNSLIFVSKYEADAYHEKVGKPACPQAVVFNGLAEHEFAPVNMSTDAADFLYIGMKRDLKGPDVFLDALAIARKTSGKNITAWFVGDGPDEAKYSQQIVKLGLQGAVRESGAMPAREAFALANIVVVPSRAESMPYLVLEAIAAQKPIICTNVGGIPEIFGPNSNLLVEPGNPQALAKSMLEMLEQPKRDEKAAAFSYVLKGDFSLKAMSEKMEAVYRSYIG